MRNFTLFCFLSILSLVQCKLLEDEIEDREKKVEQLENQIDGGPVACEDKTAFEMSRSPKLLYSDLPLGYYAYMFSQINLNLSSSEAELKSKFLEDAIFYSGDKLESNLSLKEICGTSSTKNLRISLKDVTALYDFIKDDDEDLSVYKGVTSFSISGISGNFKTKSARLVVSDEELNKFLKSDSIEAFNIQKMLAKRSSVIYEWENKEEAEELYQLVTDFELPNDISAEVISLYRYYPNKGTSKK